MTATGSIAKPTWRYAAPVALFSIAVWIYLPAVANDFVYDDYQLIVEQPDRGSLPSCFRVFLEPHCPQLPYYRPISRLTYTMQRVSSGNSPWSYQLFNIVAAGLTSLACFAFLLQRPLRLSRTTAFLLSLLFTAHPITSSCVYSVSSGREALLFALFSLSTLWIWFRSQGNANLWTAGFLLAALLSKEQAITLPFVLAVGDLTKLSWSGAGGGRRFWVLRYTPIAASVLAYIAVRLLLFSGSELRWNTSSYELPVLSLLYALQSSTLPTVDLLYEPPWPAWFSGLRACAVGAGLVVVVGYAIRLGQTWRRLLLWWGSFFVLTLLPAMNLLEQEVPFAERWVVVPSLAVIALTGSVVSNGMAIQNRGFIVRSLVASCALAITFSAVATTRQRRSTFQNSERFCERWLRVDPSNASLNAHLAYLDHRDGRPADAVRHLRRAIDRAPSNVELHVSLGSILVELGKPAAAIPAYRRALAIGPNSAEVNRRLAEALALVDGDEAAVRHFVESLRRDPDQAEVHYDLAKILDERGQSEASRVHYQRAIELAPSSWRAHFGLGLSYASDGRLDEAILQFRSALDLGGDRPKVRGHLGNALLESGDVSAAVVEYRQVIADDPDNVEANLDLGLAYSRLGRIDGSVLHYQSVIRIDPENFAATNNLAWLYATQTSATWHRPVEALRLAERVCRATHHEHAVALDTLAAALGSNDRFPEAVLIARKAVAIATRAARADLAAEIRQRVRLYENARPYLERDVSLR